MADFIPQSCLRIFSNLLSNKRKVLEKVYHTKGPAFPASFASWGAGVKSVM
jgi:hypothetical protein